MAISPRNAEFRSSMASGAGPSNPMSGGITSPGEMSGVGYGNKQNTVQMGGKILSGVTLPTFGKMPHISIKPGPGDIRAKAPKAPKLPTNPSAGMGKGAGMRMGPFNLGINGPGMRID